MLKGNWALWWEIILYGKKNLEEYFDFLHLTLYTLVIVIWSYKRQFFFSFHLGYSFEGSELLIVLLVGGI